MVVVFDGPGNFWSWAVLVQSSLGLLSVLRLDFQALEASVDDHTNQCIVGWAAMGRACVCHAAFVHGQQYSILPALTCEGMIALDIFGGSVNKECFLTFLNEQVVRLASLLNCHQLHN